jgi:hypothetical protein
VELESDSEPEEDEWAEETKHEENITSDDSSDNDDLNRKGTNDENDPEK